MNHRDLILCSAKHPMFAFTKLPHDLQDRLVADLENNRISATSASMLLKEKGYSISHAAISAYLAAVRKQRRLLARWIELSIKEQNDPL